MKSVLTTLVLGMVAAGSFAQEALPEPEYVNEAYLLKGGKLDKVEMATLKFQSKTSNYFVSMKGTTSQVIKGSQSPVRVTPDAHFVARLRDLNIDPATFIRLRAFKVGKADREYVMNSFSAHIYGNADSKPTEDTTLPITFKKYGAESVVSLAPHLRRVSTLSPLALQDCKSAALVSIRNKPLRRTRRGKLSR